MRKRANHHPDRFITWGARPRLTTRVWHHRGPRKLRLEVYEIWQAKPNGYREIPKNIPSERSNRSLRDKCCWGGNSKPGAYQRCNFVEGKALPVRRKVTKRYK